MEKQLAGGVLQSLNDVEFFAQSLDFTCGPASLMMACTRSTPPTRWIVARELRLWREATLIYTTSGTVAVVRTVSRSPRAVAASTPRCT
jgi:hypothetical protein